jgi:hypothetical protein
LLGGFVEVVAVLVGNNEFDRCGASDLHVSDVVLTIFKCLGVERLLSRGLRHSVSASSPAYSRRASDQSEALAP